MEPLTQNMTRGSLLLLPLPPSSWRRGELRGRRTTLALRKGPGNLHSAYLQPADVRGLAPKSLLSSPGAESPLSPHLLSLQIQRKRQKGVLMRSWKQSRRRHLIAPVLPRGGETVGPAGGAPSPVAPAGGGLAAAWSRRHGG